MASSSSRRGPKSTIGVLGALAALLSVWLLALKRRK
jgi:hypothetical protein